MKLIPRLPVLASALLLAFGVLAVAILGALSGKTTLYELTNDVVAAAFEVTGHRLHPLTGVMTMVGIFVWSGTIAILLFTAFFLLGTKAEGARYLMASAGVTFLLLCSDAFMIHEFMMHYYLGQTEETMFAFIGLCTLIWLAVFHRAILEVGPVLLVAALGLFATSIVVDSLANTLRFLGDWYYLAEEGPKWIGIVMWSGFHIESALTYIAKAQKAGAPAAA